MARGCLARWGQLLLVLTALGDAMCAGVARGWVGYPRRAAGAGPTLRLAGGAGASATFQVLCQDTAWGEALAIVGSTEALNAWATPVAMSGDKYPLWEATVPLEEGEIEYKYVKVDPEGQIVCWEAFEANRKVCVSPLMARTGIVIQDGQFSVESKPKGAPLRAAPPPPRTPAAMTPRTASPARAVTPPLGGVDPNDAAAAKKAAMEALGLARPKGEPSAAEKLAAERLARDELEKAKEVREKDRLRLAAEAMERAQRAAEEEVAAVREAARQALGLEQYEAAAAQPAVDPTEAARAAALARAASPTPSQARFASPPVPDRAATPPAGADLRAVSPTRAISPPTAPLSRGKPTPHAANLARRPAAEGSLGLRGNGPEEDGEEALDNAEAVRWRCEAEAARLQAVEERDEELRAAAEDMERRRKEHSDREFAEWQAEREAWLREEREEREARERAEVEEREKEALERVLLADRARRDKMQGQLEEWLEEDSRKRRELVRWQEERVKLAELQEAEVQQREAFWEREVEEREERERKEREERERELKEAEARARAAEAAIFEERRRLDEDDSEDAASRQRGRSTSEGGGGGGRVRDKGTQVTREIEERLVEEEKRLGAPPEEVQAALDLSAEQLAKLREVHISIADNSRAGGLAAWFRKLGSLWSSKKQKRRPKAQSPKP